MNRVEEGINALASNLGMAEGTPLPTIKANFLEDTDSRFYPPQAKEEMWDTLIFDHEIPDNEVKTETDLDELRLGPNGFAFLGDLGTLPINSTIVVKSQGIDELKLIEKC